jgi:hypothetical protein
MAKPPSRHQEESSGSSDEVLFYKGILKNRASRQAASRQSRQSHLSSESRVAQPATIPVVAATALVDAQITGASLQKEANQEAERRAQPDLKENPNDTSETVWKYHGRSESVASVGEPISAPTGLPAQQAEGFKRFYKAVVSPTHVRVTAGGRIVPNTRGPASPIMKRAASVNGSQNGNGERASNATIPAGFPVGAAMGPPMPPGMAPFFPGFHPGFHAGFPPGYPPGFQQFPGQMPMPYYPMPYGPHMHGPFPYGHPGMPVPMMASPPPNALKDTQNLKTGDAANDKAPQQQHKSDKIRIEAPPSIAPGNAGAANVIAGPSNGITPPVQFDHTRPFMYNGQLMVPVVGMHGLPGMPGMPMPGMPMAGMPMPGMPMPGLPGGAPGAGGAYVQGPMPVGMPVPMQGAPRPPVGPQAAPAQASVSAPKAQPALTPNLVTQPLSTAVLQQGKYFNGTGSQPSSSILMPQPRYNLGAPLTASTVSVNGFQPPPAPPSSTIKISVVTKAQLNAFRNNLKYLEDQLQYNRHQIDEKDIERKIQNMKDHIAKWEAKLVKQLETEQTEKGSDPEKEAGGAKSSAQPPANHDAALSNILPTGTVSEKTLSNQPTLSTLKPENSQSQGGLDPPWGSNTHSTVIVNMADLPSPQPSNWTSEPSTVPSWQERCMSEAVRMMRAEGLISAPGSVPSAGTLPSGAALAPPFEPRKETPEATVNTKTVDTETTDHHATTNIWTAPNYTKDEFDDIRRRLLASTGQAYGSDSGLHGSVTNQHIDYGTVKKIPSVASRGTLGVPYLIGTLPRGLNPRTAQDSDYQYSRELTDEERRARFLYWGKAPRSAQHGLPKYDGKNFYPPSPVKDTGKGKGVIESGTQAQEPSTTVDQQQYFNATVPGALGTQPSTPPGPALTMTDSFAVMNMTGYKKNQEHTYSGQFVKALEASRPLDECSMRNDKAAVSGDTSSDRSQERRYERPGGAKLWEAMLKKGSVGSVEKCPTSSAISSATAQGQLPQYAGFAAASLSPTINRTTDGTSVSPAQDNSPSKSSVDSSAGGGALLTPMPERRGKNRALTSDSSLEQQFDHYVAADGPTRSGNITTIDRFGA